MIEYENPLSYLRQVKGAPLSILVALSAASQPVAAKWLGSMTGYSPNSITSALVLLSEMQLVSCNTHRTAWRLTNGVRQLPLSPAQIPDRKNRDPVTTTALSLNGKKKNHSAEAAAFKVSDREKRDPDRKNRDPNSEEFHLSILKDVLLDIFHSASIMEPTSTTLYELDWMTIEYAEAHISQAQKNNDPTGLLIHRMKSHDPQPARHIDPDSPEHYRSFGYYHGHCVSCWELEADCVCYEEIENEETE